MLEELMQVRGALREREAELAAGVAPGARRPTRKDIWQPAT